MKDIIDLKVNMSSKCETCESEIQYSEKYDTYFCELCNTWLESKCDDPECDYCVNRPAKPSQIT